MSDYTPTTEEVRQLAPLTDEEFDRWLAGVKAEAWNARETMTMTDNRTNEPTEAQVEAAARAIADCHNPGMFEKYPENWRVEARAALVAATRVPVQGEPNDDRTPEFEAIEQELFKHQPLLSMQDGSIRGCKCMDRVFVTKTEDWGTHLAEVFTRLSRATVPDAATAALRRVAAVRLLTGFTDAELGELGGFEEETE